jgi:hypothetical protein
VRVTSPHATVEAVEQSWWPTQSRPNLRRWFYEAAEAQGFAGELSTDFARDDSEQAAQLFAPDAVLEDLTLHTAIVGRQSIAAYLARALPSLPYGQGAQVRHVVGGAAGGGYEWTNPGASAPRGVNAIKLHCRGQIVQLTSIWDGSLVTPAWITQHMSLTIES